MASTRFSMTSSPSGSPRYWVRWRSVRPLRPASHWANGAHGGFANGDCALAANGSEPAEEATGRSVACQIPARPSAVAYTCLPRDEPLARGADRQDAVPPQRRQLTLAGAACAPGANVTRGRAGHCITSAAPSTSAPPTSCTAPSDSPNAAAASATVTSGSRVERIDAADGPTRARPAKKQRIAPSVLTRAIAPTHAQPTAPNPSSGPPRRTDANAKVHVAPRQTNAASATGGTPAPTRSPMRMYTVYASAAPKPIAV